MSKYTFFVISAFGCTASPSPCALLLNATTSTNTSSTAHLRRCIRLSPEKASIAISLSSMMKTLTFWIFATELLVYIQSLYACTLYKLLLLYNCTTSFISMYPIFIGCYAGNRDHERKRETAGFRPLHSRSCCSSADTTAYSTAALGAEAVRNIERYLPL